MGAGNSSEQVRDAQRDRDADTDQEIEGDDADEGSRHQDRFAVAERQNPADLGHVDELDRGVHHQARERGKRELFEQRCGCDSTTATAAAATRLVSSPTPAAAASAVRLSEDDTGKPPRSPAAALAPASARSSWSASMRSLVRRANARPVSTFPLYATTVTPVAAREHAGPQVRRDVRKREKAIHSVRSRPCRPRGSEGRMLP